MRLDLKFYRPPPGEAQKALGLGTMNDPFIAGHEPCGVVVARGPGVSEREAPIGQRVMDHHYSGCGICKHCRVGWSQLCRAGITVYGVTAHGGHAEYMKVPLPLWFRCLKSFRSPKAPPSPAAPVPPFLH